MPVAWPDASDDSGMMTSDGSLGGPDAASTDASDGAQEAEPDPVFPPLNDAQMPVDAADDDDAGPGEMDEGPCVTGGAALAMELMGVGTCEEPLAVDLSDVAVDDEVYFDVGQALGGGLPQALGFCGQDTLRSVAFAISLPDERDVLVSIDGVAGVDFVLLAQRGSEINCDAVGSTACVDQGAAGQCEALRLQTGMHFENGQVRLLVASYDSSAAPLLLRFRMLEATPSGG